MSWELDLRVAGNSLHEAGVAVQNEYIGMLPLVDALDWSEPGMVALFAGDDLCLYRNKHVLLRVNLDQSRRMDRTRQHFFYTMLHEPTADNGSAFALRVASDLQSMVQPVPIIVTERTSHSNQLKSGEPAENAH